MKKLRDLGSIYFVEKVYELSDDYMRKHNLYYKKRVRLKKISGENGLDIEDFAISDSE
ncbi:hypothetical protein [Desulfosporosinus sp. OT]|uniref:hypothetical protein n=1 Tax=Desulfosporosinus sp. OT TaxID=913865 RepID=UPI001300C2BE|nr:hypothetical protein [Desulfosporosinus sp. OT]